MRPIDNTDCSISQTSLCKWLNREDCYGCYINSLKGDAREEALDRWSITQSLVPDDIGELAGDKCQFCKQGEPKKQSSYGIIDMAHQKPDSKKAMFFGIGKKVSNPIGSFLQLSVSCCSDCRRRFMMYDVIKWVTMILAVAAGILVSIFIPPSKMFGGGLGDFAPFVVLVICVIIGAILSMVLSESYMKAASKKTHTNAMDIPIIAEMKEMGWFLPAAVQERTNVTRVIFSKKQMTPMANLKYKGDTPGCCPPKEQ